MIRECGAKLNAARNKKYSNDKKVLQNDIN